ncbi:Methylisocitrate lyase [Serratia entomophila]|uniref:isocitrate lyase/PEP mutase family protein n=1 Tax=Serratia entomophila TaxID=42906 RepID=UPI002178CFF7|nr:isocitrate lyase/phosphoenolpyruvate mutase family protein [Serratia entomophila]CAI1907842.1 Methylisocitrate lyase [Serratia entomophila]
MNQKSDLLKKLHEQESPLFLYNIWDAGTAKIVANNGASAVATSSWSVSEAQGYNDGQTIPYPEFLIVIKNIVNAVNLPVTVDFESGYAADIKTIQRNLLALLELGVAGINFEDQNIYEQGIYDVETQCKRIAALREVADLHKYGLFINARTDVFLKESNVELHRTLINSAIERARAYKDAGANGFFIPGTTDPEVINEICSAVSLPVNVMDLSDNPDIDAHRKCGVKRVSIGPKSWFEFCNYFQQKNNQI